MSRYSTELSVDIRQPFANVSMSEEISDSGGPVDDASISRRANLLLERLYQLGKHLQDHRSELESALSGLRPKLALLPGIVTEDQFREVRSSLKKALREGRLENEEYQRWLTPIRQAFEESRWLFEAQEFLFSDNPVCDRWVNRAPSVSLLAPADAAATLAAARAAWDEFFVKAFPFDLTARTREQIVRILDGRQPLVNELPAAGCGKCGRGIQEIGGHRIMPRRGEMEGPALDEAGHRRWICQRCAHVECHECGSILKMPMGRNVLHDDGDLRHFMIAPIARGYCSNPACPRH